MLYNIFSQERRYTRPSRFVGRNGRGDSRARRRDRRRDIITVSTNMRGLSDDRGTLTPVYTADLFNRPDQEGKKPMREPVSPFEMDRRRTLATREGVNLRLGVGVLLTALGTMLLVVALSIGVNVSINSQINTDTQRAEELKKMCYDLEVKIAAGESEVQVSATAVQMGMISARGMDVIRLTAPEAAIMTNPGTGTLTAEYLGTIFGD